VSDYIDEPDVLLYEVTGHYTNLESVMTGGTRTRRTKYPIWLNLKDLSAHSQIEYAGSEATVLHFVSGLLFVADIQFADFHSEYMAAMEDPHGWSKADEEDKADGYGLMQILPDEVAARYEAHLRGELSTPVLFDVSEGKPHPDAITRVASCESEHHDQGCWDGQG